MKRNTPRHAKTRALSKTLGVPRCTAVGLLELLWHATAQLTPRGDIGRLEDDHIAEELFWEGDSRALIEALVSAGWLDRCGRHRLLVHGWKDHCDQTVRRTRAVRDLGFACDSTEPPAASAELVTDELLTSVPGTRNPEPETLNQSRPGGARTPVKPGPDPWALELAEVLIEKIRPITGARIPRGSKFRWAREMENLVAETPSLARSQGDGTLRRGIEWAFSDANLGLEYEVVIRSGSALRRKWTTLCEAKKRSKRKANGSGKPPVPKRASEFVFGSREWCAAAGIDFETYQRQQADEAQRKADA